MIKQCAAVTLMAMTVLMGSSAWAAREEHIFEVSVIIPTLAFYVIPAEPDWIHRPQRLNWNISNSTLSSVRKHFDVRHDSSAIEARLETAPYLSNGKPGDDIALRVSFNGVELSPDIAPRQVVSAADAMTGSRVLLQIDPVKPEGGYKPGDYSGSVLVLFSAKAPEA
ncbi:hypothetical protein PS838_03563 [Pseudomonas fluorescens]|jgi:hypothetical protein|nr:hypothetical protein PS838_03563 [Pseudomonas fluorescens]